MVNLKKYNDVLKLFVIFLTLYFTVSHINTSPYPKIEVKQILSHKMKKQKGGIENFANYHWERCHHGYYKLRNYQSQSD